MAFIKFWLIVLIIWSGLSIFDDDDSTGKKVFYGRFTLAFLVGYTYLKRIRVF